MRVKACLSIVPKFIIKETRQYSLSTVTTRNVIQLHPYLMASPEHFGGVHTKRLGKQVWIGELKHRVINKLEILS